METLGHKQRNTSASTSPDGKEYLLETEMSEMLDIAKQAVAPNKRLRGQGPIALTLANERGWGVRAISRFLSSHGLPVSPAAVSKFLAAERAKTSEATN